MNYAVIKQGGKQYKVASGDVIELEGTLGKKDDKIVFSDVLLLVAEDKTDLGKPMVSGAKVSGTIVENKKGEKIRVSKFKAKARYRRTIGFRAVLTVVKIDSLPDGKLREEKKVTENKRTIVTKRKSANMS